MSSDKPDVFRYFCEPRNVEHACIFCKIADGRVKPGKRSDPQKLVFEDDQIVAFDDIAPGAERHILVITKNHVKNCWALQPKLLDEIDRVADGLIEKFRFEGQTTRKFFIRPPWNSVYHVHLHVMIGDLTDSKFNPRRLGFESPWFHITPDQLRQSWKSL